MVLGGDLDADLEVLTDVRLQHGLDALKGVLNGQRAEVVHQPLGVQQVSVDDCTFYVVQVGVVLKCLGTHTHIRLIPDRQYIHIHTYIRYVRVILTRCFHKEELLKQQLDFHEPDIFPCHSTYSVRAVQENPVVWSSFVL